MKAALRAGLQHAACGTVILLVFVAELAKGDVVVISLTSNSTRDVFLDLPATFGHAIPDEGILGRFSTVDPEDGCSLLNATDDGYDPNHIWIALIRKGGCDYKTKVSNAMVANFSAVIIYNVGSNRLELMRCKGSGCSSLIPSMFIGADDGILLQGYGGEGRDKFILFLTEDLPFDLNKYLLPFAVVVGVCFLILLMFMVYKCIRDSRRARRHRMPWRALKKIPQIKFKKGDPYEICAICLDDYQEGEKLRVLTCSHAFHCKCVDPWLTKSRRVCPICKRKVFASDERHRANDDSSSDDEDGGGSRRQTRRNTAAQADDEAAPLLSGRGGGGGGAAASQMSAIAAAVPASAMVRQQQQPSRRSRLRAFRLFGRRTPTAAAAAETTTAPVVDVGRVTDYGAARPVDSEHGSGGSTDFASDHSINGDSFEYPHGEQRDRGPHAV